MPAMTAGIFAPLAPVTAAIPIIWAEEGYMAYIFLLALVNGVRHNLDDGGHLMKGILLDQDRYPCNKVCGANAPLH